MYLNFLKRNKIEAFINDTIRTLVETNRWEMLKIILSYDELVGISWLKSAIFKSRNEQAIEKAIEHGLITQNLTDQAIKNIKSYDVSPQVYKSLCKMYPNIYDVDLYLDTLKNGLLFDPDLINEIIEVSRNTQDCASLLNKYIDIPTYNCLIQKIPKETIIDSLINPKSFYYFDSALIDLLDIRQKLQSKIDEAEAKFIELGTINKKIINPFYTYLIFDSGLNFRKMVLMYNIIQPESNHRHILKNLPQDYFTDSEKSYFMVQCIQQNAYDITDYVIPLGWKIQDTPENRDTCAKYIKFYNKIPKY